MEGIAGIAHIRQVMRGTDDYPRSRELMTEEANAAVGGAFEGGATRVVVNDSHGDMTNLLPDLMDPRAELTLGSPKIPHSMMTGIGKNFGCALFVGFHAGVRTAEVKQASGRHVATSLSPASARKLIREAAADAVRGAGSLEPFRPEPPFELEADTANTVSAELCALAPGVDRVGPRTVRFRTDDFAPAFRCLLAW